jgi:hypothetical protein
LIPALEAASVLFLEVEYGWTPRDGCYAVGIAFVVGLLAVSGLRNWTGVQVGKMLLPDAVMAFLFCLLLFPDIDDIFLSRHSTWILILAADAAIFTFETVSLMQSTALAALVTIPGSDVFNHRFFTFVSYLITAGCRFAAPFLSRYIILRGDRFDYAMFQSCLCLINIGVAASIMASLKYCSKDSFFSK